ncbi:MAG TPA: hypothetical protein VGG33_15600, partial [Polyangia bacterium]
MAALLRQATPPIGLDSRAHHRVLNRLLAPKRRRRARFVLRWALPGVILFSSGIVVASMGLTTGLTRWLSSAVSRSVGQEPGPRSGHRSPDRPTRPPVEPAAVPPASSPVVTPALAPPALVPAVTDVCAGPVASVSTSEAL